MRHKHGSVLRRKFPDAGSSRPRALLAALGVLLALLTGSLVIDVRPAHAGATRDQIVSVAQAEIGASEANGGCLKYGPCTTQEWCAYFAEWVWRNAGVSPVFDTAVARAVGLWGVNSGLWSARPSDGIGNPEPGDVVVYGTPAQATGGHVSIVASVNADGTIDTIDGNWNEAVVRRSINPLTQRAGADNLLIAGYVKPPGVTATPMDGSLSGDGRAEVVLVESSGNLKAWYNGRGFTNTPWTSDTSIGNGFTDPSRVRFADISGDGKKELIYIEPSGNLKAWYNGRGFTNTPWTSDTSIGNGFTDPSRVHFADISGDGRAELILVEPSGNLKAWYNGRGFTNTPWTSDTSIG
ncbi:FG-GAP-like repeat-containing protein, partial [Nonomuraea typhae]|uniref:FG-GAP-like repeat-containing protein n=1 Tax=Nonomuraea typhae TaxID=2603600 RepID=UPI001CA5AFD4